jgi:hypothetical protein
MTSKFPSILYLLRVLFVYKIISHRIYDCSDNLSPIKFRISGVYVSLFKNIETNLNIIIGQASLCFTECRKSSLTKVLYKIFKASEHNSGFYMK